MNTPLDSNISDLARGLGKLLNKGDWSFWYGDSVWYNLKAPLNGRANWAYGDMIDFCKHDNEVRFVASDDGWPANLLSRADQTYLRDIFERLYLAPVLKQQEDRVKQEAIEREARTKGRIAELEKLGRET